MSTGVKHEFMFVGTGINLLGLNSMKGGKIIQLASGLPLATHMVSVGISMGTIDGRPPEPFINFDGMLMTLEDETKEFVRRGVSGYEVIAPTGIERHIFDGAEVRGPIKKTKGREAEWEGDKWGEEINTGYPDFLGQLESI